MDTAISTNYSGAIIFWLYIIAALTFSTIILHTIYKTNIQNPQRQKIPPFLILLAISSFSTLSYHMLNVLIQSYTQWSHLHTIPLPANPINPGTYLGPNRTPLHLWHWSTTSTLFQDFGEAIVATAPRYLMTSTGLWTTMCISPFLGIEGRNTGVPNLWAFFGLLEILPTSFAQILFYIMLSVQPRSPSQSGKVPGVKVLWCALPVAYAICLHTAASASGAYLVQIILAARLLLLLPLFLPLSSGFRGQGAGSRSVYNFCALVAQVFVISRAVMVLREHGVTAILEALQSHPAVKTLGYDLLHSAIAFWYWRKITSGA